MIKIFVTAFVLAFTSSTLSFADLAKIDLNTATQQQLEDLPGIGPSLAKKLIEARPFKSVEDLSKVKGMGSKAEKLKALVSVGSGTVASAPVSAPITSALTTKATAAKEAITQKVETVKEKVKKVNQDLAPGEKVSLNNASLEQLEKLPRIGPKKAQAIIEARPFQSVEDVMKVKGIKQGLFNKIKDFITL